MDKFQNRQAAQEIPLEKIFEGFFKASMDGFFIVDNQGRFREVNQSFCELIGYSRGELLGMSIPDIEARETPERTREHIEEIIRSGKARFETAHRHKGGHTIEVEVSVTFLEIESTRFLLSFVRDLSDIKKTDRQIEVRNTLLGLFIKTSSRKEYMDGVVKALRDWSGYTAVGLRVLNEQGNIPYESYVGFPDEFRSVEICPSVIDDQCACVRAITTKMGPQDRPVLTPAGSFYFDDMKRFMNELQEKDRIPQFSDKCIHSSFSSAAIIPIHYGEKVLGVLHFADAAKGKIVPEMIHFVESIAPLIGEGIHRFNLEEELKRNYDAQFAINSLLQLSLKNSPVNEILQRALDLVLSIPWLSFESRGSIFLVEEEPGILIMKAHRGMSENLLKACQRVPFGRCVCGRTASSGELHFTSSLDETHEVRYEGISPHGHYCVPIRFSKQVLGVIDIYVREGHRRLKREVEFLTAIANTLAGIIVRRNAELEISNLNKNLERRIIERTAELERANKELEAFSYSVSHDLRNPLIAVSGLSQLLLERNSDHLDPKSRHLITLIRTEMDNMRHLIDNLLSLSRIQYSQIKSCPIDMDELLHGVLEELKFLTSNRKVEWKIGSLPPCCGDSNLLRQVLFNLLSNAIKYTKQEPVAMIEAGGRTENDRSIYYVRDNGVGFDKMHADKLFQPFKRFHSSDEFDGAGVGLAIVKRIIERHDGAIWAEGEVGKGATFHFILPAAC